MKNYLMYIALLLLCYSCDDIIELDDISDDRVELLAPANGVISTNSTISFSWEKIEEADEYQLQVAKPSFEEAIEILSDTITPARTFQETYEEGDFEWRVRALNDGYKTNYTTQDFSIALEE